MSDGLIAALLIMACVILGGLLLAYMVWTIRLSRRGGGISSEDLENQSHPSARSLARIDRASSVFMSDSWPVIVARALLIGALLGMTLNILAGILAAVGVLSFNVIVKRQRESKR
jgi:hypothetical protein